MGRCGDRVAGDHVEQDVPDLRLVGRNSHAFPRLRGEISRERIPGLRTDAAARLYRNRKQEPDRDRDRDRGRDQVVSDRLPADAAELAYVSERGDADHERCDHERDDDHRDRLDESAADEVQRGPDHFHPQKRHGLAGQVDSGADGDSKDQSQGDLRVELHSVGSR